jgi:hypothetical protein
MERRGVKKNQYFKKLRHSDTSVRGQPNSVADSEAALQNVYAYPGDSYF